MYTLIMTVCFKLDSYWIKIFIKNCNHYMQKSKQRISFKPQVKTEIHKSPWKSTKKAHLQIEALKLIKLIVNVSILNRKLLLKVLVKISQGQGKDQLQSSYQTHWGPLLNGLFFKQQELSSIAMNTWTILWSYPSEHWESKKAFLWITFMIFLDLIPSFTLKNIWAHLLFWTE